MLINTLNGLSEQVFKYFTIYFYFMIMFMFRNNSCCRDTCAAGKFTWVTVVCLKSLPF